MQILHKYIFCITCKVKIFHEKQSDKKSATSSVTGFAGVIDDAILPPLARSCAAKKNTWSGTSSQPCASRRIGVTWNLFSWLKSWRRKLIFALLSGARCGWLDGREQVWHANSKTHWSLSSTPYSGVSLLWSDLSHWNRQPTIRYRSIALPKTESKHLPCCRTLVWRVWLRCLSTSTLCNKRSWKSFIW